MIDKNHCCVLVWVREEDVDRFNDLVGGFASTGHRSAGGFVELESPKHDYGFPEIDDFENQDIVFVGSHGSGRSRSVYAESIDSAEFASDGRETAYLYGKGGEHSVAFDTETCEPKSSSLAYVKKRLELIMRVKLRMNQTDLEKLANVAKETRRSNE